MLQERLGIQDVGDREPEIEAAANDSDVQVQQPCCRIRKLRGGEAHRLRVSLQKRSGVAAVDDLLEAGVGGRMARFHGDGTAGRPPTTVPAWISTTPPDVTVVV